MADVLQIDQDYDIVTRYGQAFRDKLVFANFASDFPTHRLHACKNADATRSKIDAKLTSNSVKFVTGMGHGLYTTFTGQHGAVIWDDSDNFSYMKDMIVHLLSCQTGALLGRKMVSDGVAAFWGYTVNFTFYHRNPVPHALDSDPTAEMYLRMDAIIDRGILKNMDSQSIYDAVTRYVAKALPKMKNAAQRSVLLDDYVHLVCPATTWGDAQATL